jgi:O-antigen ligase
VNTLSPALFLYGLITSAFVFSSLSTKAMGLAWILITGWGIFAGSNHLRTAHKNTAPSWLHVWLLCTGLALVFKVGLTAYWSDPWGERHGELRLFLGALAVYGLLCMQPFNQKVLVHFAHALSLSSVLGLFWVTWHDRGALPTHHIPWAGSLAMVSAFLLALSLKSDFSLGCRRLWFLGGLFAVMAVLASQSRGAYAIVFWWLGVCTHHFFLRSSVLASSKGRTQSPNFFVSGMVLFMALLVFAQTAVFERASQSVLDAAQEISVSQQSTAQGSNSSVGARIYMWQQSLAAIAESPWIGHGHDGRRQLLEDWADAADSQEIKRLGHVHNEYLHQWIDHGLWGLSSQLLYLLGLVLMVWRLQRNNLGTAAVAVAGITFVHLTSSMTNVNFAHNYYTASLSLFVSLSLWLSQLPPKQAA